MIYPFACDKCGYGVEFVSSVADRPIRPKCPRCSTVMHREYSPPQVNMHQAYDWSNENGGRGRKIDSLKNKHWEEGPHLYKRNRQELIETYKSMELRHDVC